MEVWELRAELEARAECVRRTETFVSDLQEIGFEPRILASWNDGVTITLSFSEMPADDTGQEEPIGEEPVLPEAIAPEPAASRWSPHDDLALIEGLSRGETLDQIAQQLNCTRDDAQARFFELLPKRPTMEAQTQLITKLRAQIGDA